MRASRRNSPEARASGGRAVPISGADSLSPASQALPTGGMLTPRSVTLRAGLTLCRPSGSDSVENDLHQAFCYMTALETKPKNPTFARAGRTWGTHDQSLIQNRTETAATHPKAGGSHRRLPSLALGRRMDFSRLSRPPSCVTSSLKPRRKSAAGHLKGSPE
jgi:hypothetical protein